MRLLLTISLFFTSFVAVAQADSISLKNAMQKLDKALIEKDYSALQSVLNKDVSYGHSNGWVQNKKDILNDLKSGKLVYIKIKNNETKIVAVRKKWATVRTNTNAEGSISGTAFQFKIACITGLDKYKEGLGIIGKAEFKIVSMKKSIPRILYYIFLTIGIMLTLYGMYLRRSKQYEKTEVISYIVIGSAFAAVICWLIDKILPKNFGTKPTREEIEKQVHRE